MSKLIVRSFTISLDGYGAGPSQSLQNPLGVGGEELHEWMIPTPSPSTKCSARRAARPARTIDFTRCAVSTTSARGFSAATCSARSGARGPTGILAQLRGVRTRPITRLFSFLRTTSGSRLEMEGGTVFPLRHRGHSCGTGECAGRGRWPGHSPPWRRHHHSPIPAGLAWLKGCTWQCRRSCSAPGEHLLAGLDLPALGYEFAEKTNTDAATHLIIRKTA